VTRKIVLELAAAAHLHITERRLRRQDLLDADEVFLTSSLAEIVPVTAVDDHAIKDGAIGPHTKHLHLLYRQMVDRAVTRRSAP